MSPEDRKTYLSLAERRTQPTEGRPREEYRLVLPQLTLFP